MEQVSNSGAISKLVRMPLFDALLERATDVLYAEHLARARSPNTKLALLKQYLQEPKALTNRSNFLTTEIGNLLSEAATRTIFKRKPDPVKTAIAEIFTEFPEISHVDLCSKLDDKDIRVPERYCTSPNCTWTFAFKNKRMRSRLKPYFSKIKSKIGKRNQLPQLPVTQDTLTR